MIYAWYTKILRNNSESLIPHSIITYIAIYSYIATGVYNYAIASMLVVSAAKLSTMLAAVAG